MDKPTGAKPITVDGVTFTCWRTGIMQYTWRDASGRANIGRPFSRVTYFAIVDGKKIGDRYRSQKSAMRAAVKALKESK